MKKETYKTQDGKVLKEGDACYVALQCGRETHKLSPKPRAGFYRSQEAIDREVDFLTLKPLRTSSYECDCCGTCEVIGVWKKKP